MTHVSPTVTDVSRAVAELNDDGCVTGAGANALVRVVDNLGHQFSRHQGWAQSCSQAEARAALMAHGASPVTVRMFSREIARRIRQNAVDTVNT